MKGLAEYHRLLREASAASDSVDKFDLDSTNPESVAAFGQLLEESKLAQLALIRLINWYSFSLVSSIIESCKN